MNVFTYHSTIPSWGGEDELKLVLLWVQNWREAGYNPVVLNEYVCMEHPLYKPLLDKVSNWPTTNPRDYEVACFMRWLAVAQATLSGEYSLMVDTDVFKNGPTKTGQGKITELTALHLNHVPAAVIGTKQHFLEQVERFIAYNPRPDETHLSDQMIFTQQTETHAYRVACKAYLDDGWEFASMVHFSTSVMAPHSLTPKYQHIPNLLQHAKSAISSMGM